MMITYELQQYQFLALNFSFNYMNILYVLNVF